MMAARLDPESIGAHSVSYNQQTCYPLRSLTIGIDIDVF